MATEMTAGGGHRSMIGGGRGLGFRWTGHPMIDAGVAAIVAHAGVKRPEELTEAHLENFVNFAESFYNDALHHNKHVTILFTNNLFDPAGTKARDRWRNHPKELLQAFKRTGTGPPCPYFGEPSLTDGADAWRPASRTLIPLAGSKEDINFGPSGSAGVWICGKAITALQALVVATPRVSGRVLVVTADSETLRIRLAREWLDLNSKWLALTGGSDSEVPSMSRPKTRLVETLSKIMQELREHDVYGSVTAWWLTNSGQGTDFRAFTCQEVGLRFLRKAQRDEFAADWNGLVARWWWDPRKEAEAGSPTAGNDVYEALLELPGESERFVSRVFKRHQFEAVRGSARPIGWPLVDLFLEEVLGMERARIEVIRKLGDVIADHVVETNDRGLYRRVTDTKRRWSDVTDLLIFVSRRRVADGQTPLATMDETLLVFSDALESAPADWRLAWDLIVIRFLEQVYAKGWAREHAAELGLPVDEGPELERDTAN